MLSECLDLLRYEGARRCEVHARPEGSQVYLWLDGERAPIYAPTSRARLAVLTDANSKALVPAGAFQGPGVYTVDISGALTFDQWSDDSIIS